MFTFPHTPEYLDDTIDFSKGYKFNKDMFMQALEDIVYPLFNNSLKNYTFYKDKEDHTFKGHICIVDGERETVDHIKQIVADFVIIKNCKKLLVEKIDTPNLILENNELMLLGEGTINTVFMIHCGGVNIHNCTISRLAGFCEMFKSTSGKIKHMVLATDNLNTGNTEMEKYMTVTPSTININGSNFDSSIIEFTMNFKMLSKLNAWVSMYSKHDEWFKMELYFNTVNNFITEYMPCGDFPIQWLISESYIPKFETIMDKYDYMCKSTEKERKEYWKSVKIPNTIFDYMGPFKDIVETLWDNTAGKVIEGVSTMFGSETPVSDDNEDKKDNEVDPNEGVSMPKYTLHVRGLMPEEVEEMERMKQQSTKPLGDPTMVVPHEITNAEVPTPEPTPVPEPTPTSTIPQGMNIIPEESFEEDVPPSSDSDTSSK